MQNLPKIDSPSFSPASALALFVVALAGHTVAAPVQLHPAPGPRPIKLVMSAVARNVGGGAQAEVEVSLRDAENRPVPARKALRVGIEARQFSGVQKVLVTVEAGSTSARRSFDLHEGGLIELRASHPELRPDTTFVRLKPFTASPAQAVEGFVASSPAKAPDYYFGREVARIGGTADDITGAAHSVE